MEIVKTLYAVDDPERAALYAEAVIAIVGEDERVTAALANWASTAQTTGVNHRHAALKEIIASLVFDDLRLSYVWLADWLEMLFYWTEHTGGPVSFEVKVFGLPPKAVIRAGTRPGKRRLVRIRAPKGGRAAVDQDVMYWYRHRVAQKRATKYALARELRARQGESLESDGRDTIKAAIERTERILQSVGAGGSTYIKFDILASAKIATAYIPRK